MRSSAWEYNMVYPFQYNTFQFENKQRGCYSAIDFELRILQNNGDMLFISNIQNPINRFRRFVTYFNQNTL